MALSSITNHAHRVLAECRGSALQTAMVGTLVSTGFIGLGLALHPGPGSNTKERLGVGGMAAVFLLSSAHPYSRVVGAIFATFMTAIAARKWQDEDFIHLSDKLTAILPPVAAISALAIRAYMLKT